MKNFLIKLLSVVFRPLCWWEAFVEKYTGTWEKGDITAAGVVYVPCLVVLVGLIAFMAGNVIGLQKGREDGIEYAESLTGEKLASGQPALVHLNDQYLIPARVDRDIDGELEWRWTPTRNN